MFGPFSPIPALPLVSALIGGKQVGPAAPPMQIGGLPPHLSNPLPDPADLSSIFSGRLEDVVPDYFRAGSAPPMDFTNDELDPVAENLKQSSLADINNGIAEGDVNNPFKQFLGGLDTGLQSPSQVLGLGLLGRLHPNAPLAGLAAMGLLNSGLLKR